GGGDVADERKRRSMSEFVAKFLEIFAGLLSSDDSGQREPGSTPALILQKIAIETGDTRLFEHVVVLGIDLLYEFKLEVIEHGPVRHDVASPSGCSGVQPRRRSG